MVAVTGANGHLGANLVRALVARQRTVRALTFGSPHDSLDGVNVDRVEGDIRDAAFVRQALAGARVVYHLAAIIAQHAPASDCMSVNVEGARNVLEACLSTGVRRLIHVSSVRAMVELPGTAVLDEDGELVAPTHPVPYCASKALGEHLVIEAARRGLETVVLAPTSTFGPHDYGRSPMTRLFLDICQNRMPVLPNCYYDWVDVRDVVELAVAAEERAPRGRKYLVSGHFTHFPELAKLAGGVVGVPPPRLVLPAWTALPAAYAATVIARLTGGVPFVTPQEVRVVMNERRRFSHARATAELGYRPRPLEESIVDTVRWMSESGVL